MSRLRNEFQIIPRGLRLVVGVSAVALFALIVAATTGEVLPFRMFAATVVTSLLSLYVLLIGYVFADAKRRGMRAALWTLIAIFVPSAIGILGYFLLREPILTPCGRCGTPARREFAFCPDCGATLRRACPACNQAVEPFWVHCAHCGVSLEEEQPASPAPADEDAAPEASATE